MNNSMIKLMQRILSMVLVAVMVIALIPLATFASTNDNFIISVKDESDAVVDGADVSYEIFVDNESKAEGNVTTVNGEAVITDVSNFTTEVEEGKSVQLSYEITKEGYQTVNNTVSIENVADIIYVTFYPEAEVPESVNVSVTTEGNGKVKINDEETSAKSVVKNSDVKITITPDSGSYIKQVKIGNETENITDKNIFEKTINPTEDVNISVIFVKSYTITVSKNNNGGRIKLNGEATTSKVVDDNSEVEVVVEPIEGYQIDNVKIGDEQQVIDNENIFKKTIKVTKNTTISVTFVEVYTITVTYDGEGNVVTDPECDGGKVTVKTGKEVIVSATPGENYRVSKVVVNGKVDSEFSDNTYNSENAYKKTIKADKDYKIEITFSLKVYSLDINASKHGEVSVDNTTVNYGDSAILTIVAEKEYTLDNVTVNDSNKNNSVVTKDDKSLELRIDNITEDLKIDVSFKQSEETTMNEVSWNSDEALRNVDSKLYVFSEGDTVKFSTEKDGIRINGNNPLQNAYNTQEIDIIEDTQIDKIELYYDLGWHEVKIDGEPVNIKIVFDNNKPVPAITLEGNNRDYYNKDIPVSISAIDEGDYSGINTVEYWITCDGTETIRETVYSYKNGDEIISEFEDDITIDAEDNNSDNVIVNLKVTDRAGNEDTTREQLKVNTTTPTAKVEIDGEHSNIINGKYYFTGERKAVVTVKDRNSCFDEKVANAGIDITATDKEGNPVNIDKTKMISWTHNEDIHIATITFSQESNYTWSFLYTSKSGLSNEGFETENGESIFEFTVDKTAPTGVISIDADNEWNSLLATITFGLWRNYNVEVRAEGNDVISPMHDVEYYKSNSTEPLSKDYLDALYDRNEFTTEYYSVSADEQFVVYARITDYAGNYTYISTNGIIVDKSGSKDQIVLTPEVANSNGYYNKDVEVIVDVNEEILEGQAYSGIKTVDYKVFKDDSVTQSENLYTFDIENPRQPELKKTWNGKIVVDASKNNSDNVKVVATVVDNAGNVFSNEIPLKINSGDPTISVRFDNNNPNRVDDNIGYFGRGRKATITIVDRDTTFNETNATDGIKIEAVDNYGNAVAINRDEMIGSWDTVGDTHTATVNFSEDANYKWSLEYKNDADVSNSDINTNNSITPFEFTVDTKKPEGTVSVDNNVWNELLSTLTFGLYKNTAVQVSATSSDDTSPTEIEYYKTSRTTVMTADELDAVSGWAYFAGSDIEKNGISPDEKFTLYLKISDYAGNYRYISTNGVILDSTGSKNQITLTPDRSNSNNYYNGDVNVVVDVNEEVKQVYSGIKTVDYKVFNGDNVTQSGNLYTFDIENPKHSELKKTWNGNIVVDASKNNSDNVKVVVSVVDNADNLYSNEVQLKINTDRPTVSIALDNNEPNKLVEDRGYFATARKATITIVDRDTTFNETNATEGIKIEAVDNYGNAVAINRDEMIGSWDTVGDTHTATVNFSEDANYKWSLEYKNDADVSNSDINTNNSITPFEFTVDTKKPEGTVSVDNNVWNELLSTLTFGLYKNTAVQVSATSSDDTSPTEIEYYKTSRTTVMTADELDAVSEWAYFAGSDIEKNGISPNEQFTVYLKITDYAGNYDYVCTDGYIVENNTSEIVLTPEEANDNGIYGLEYKDGINVDVKVSEKDIYSGIKTVDYWVKKDGIKTQEGNLFTFEGANPEYNDLKKEWTGSLKVDPEKNDSSNTVLYVNVIDNAGNETTESVNLDIDVTQPTIKILYDDTYNVNAKSGYFTSRSARIKITERTNHFDPDVANNGINITAVDAKGEIVENAYSVSEWQTTEGPTANEATHTATVKFNKDANYKFEISYTDNGDNTNTIPDVNNQLSPYEFTIDTQKPVGTISVDDNIWTELLETLTFGLYKNDTVNVSVTSDDDTSPTEVEYFKTSRTTVLKVSELDKITEWKNFVGSDLEKNGISPNEQFVIYLKITDFAGNYKYINSDGFTVEKSESNIVLTPEKANSNGIYGLDYLDGIKVDVNISDSSPCSGIKTVDYWTECDGVKTEEGNLFTFGIANPTHEQLVDNWNGSITVDPKLNNSCNVLVYVKTVDNAGNEKINSAKLDIDVTKPAINISYDDTYNKNAKEGYFTSRKATVSISERSHHFDYKAATKGIEITAVDINGKAVEDAYVISEWKTVEGETSDTTTHIATIEYKKDANYKFAISYTDKADNNNSTPDVTGQSAPYEFTVDTIKPEGTITAKSSEGRTETWSSLLDSLTFGFWSNEKISVSGTSMDDTSPILSVQYYMAVANNASDATTALRAEDLDNISSWSNFDGFDITSNKQFVVYLKIMDNAGNYTYVGTNGLIVDDKHPIIESVAPEISVTPEKPINGIYRDDVKVSIKVEDPMIGGTYSGLSEVHYKVFDRARETSEIPTQEGVLYKFNKENPKQSDLLKIWTGDITIDSKKNNSNKIQIVVYATDNAGNTCDNSQRKSKGYSIIKIDTTAPVIDISYKDSGARNGKYFNQKRVATIKITERNFDKRDVNIKITNTEGKIPALTEWTDTCGSYNRDDATHTANIVYSADGDYTFAIEYTDSAGNKCKKINYASGTIAARKFTIDKVKPTVKVSYDNNAAANGNYYKAVRTATVVINEHNFKESDVVININATNDNKPISAPRIKGWSTLGDKHTATIEYTNNAKYIFDIEFKDMAGNSIADFEKQTFYIDTEKPKVKITGVEDKSANSGDVVPVVTCSDTNFDNSKMKVTLTGANRQKVALLGKYSNIHNGKVFTFNNFEKEKSIDDIYTLTATLTDKAGNSDSKEISFSVNRFGSTYIMSKDTSRINGSYAKKPTDIVLTEVNANVLSNIKITLFKNDKTYVLKRGSDYRVDISGGNGLWYQYKYTVYKKNFTEDGVYRLNMYSKDAAGNIAENTLDTKNTEIGFGIDKTLPTINAKNLESGKTYALDNLKVDMAVDDNLKLASVVVFLDGKKNKDWTKAELAKNIADGGNFSFNVSGDSTGSHKVKIVALDEAGNETIEEISDFYVTTNVLVRYINNKPLFFGSIAGVILIAGLIIFIIVIKKRNKEEITKS